MFSKTGREMLWFFCALFIISKFSLKHHAERKKPPNSKLIWASLSVPSSYRKTKLSF